MKKIVLIVSLGVLIIFLSNFQNPVEVPHEMIVDKSKGEWTLMVIPDMQRYTEDWSEQGYEWQEEVTTFKWMVTMSEDMNIKFVQSLGDMVQSSPENGGHNNLEWGRAQQMYDLLLDAGIPAVPLAGNHEWGSDNDYTWLNKYFPLSKFQSRDWWGGNINGIENTYQQLILGQEKYLFISIGWKITDDVKEWAKNIIQSHSDHKVIISHHYKAKVPFAELVDPFENVIMTLHGHVNKETYETSNNGRTHSFEQGFQDEGFDAGEKGDCQIRYFIFKPLEDKVEWWTYSVVMNEGKGGYWTKQPSSQGSFHLVQIGPGESAEEK